jgi:hypothetical protein
LGSTVTTQSWVLRHWAGLTVTFNATDHTISTVIDFTSFTTTVAVGTVANVSVNSASDIDTGTDTITANSHGFNNNALVRIITGGTIPGGLTNGDSYYIVNKTANTFQLSLTPGGAAINITSTGTGSQSIQPMLVTKFGNNSYWMNKRGSVSLLNGSTEYSKATDQVATLADTQILTNKTIDLTDNTITGATAEFNAALSDGDFSTLAGSETLINKTLGSVTMQDAADIAVNTSNGTKFGTASNQKIALWGATPVAQHSSTGETTGFTAGAGTAVNDDSTFTGNVGSTAYRLSDIVKALKKAGIIAS